MADARIGELLELQHRLAVEKGWIADRVPEKGHMSLLWSIDELGEVIAILKKKGAAAVMENESVRAHFTEEIADVFMYLFDMMECYGITAEEFSEAYLAKFRRNLDRDWRENDALYEKSGSGIRYICFAASVFGNRISPAAHLLESLTKTDLALAVAADALPAGLDADGIALASGMTIPAGYAPSQCLFCVSDAQTEIPAGAERLILDFDAPEDAENGWGTLLSRLGF